MQSVCFISSFTEARSSFTYLPVGGLVKWFSRRKSQKATYDSAAAQIPALVAHMTPFSSMLYFQHSLCHQATLVAGQDRA